MRIPESDWGQLVAPSDRVVFAAVPFFGGGDSGGNSIFTGNTTSTATDQDRQGITFADAVGQILLTLIVAAVVSGLQLAAAALSPRPRTPTFGQQGSGPEEVSGVRRFTGAQSTAGSGVPIPVIFGEVRTGGHIVEAYNDVTFRRKVETNADGVTVNNLNDTGREAQVAIGARSLNTRLVYCWGPVESMTEHRIDGNSGANIPGIAIQNILGTKVGHTAPEGFSDTKIERDVVSEVTNTGGALIRSTVQEVDTIEVGLLFGGGLYEVDNTNGNLIQRNVRIKFEYRESVGPGSWQDLKTIDVSARQRSALDVWIRFPQLTRAKYDIRVTRVTADNAASNINDEFTWNKYIEVQNGNRAHPGVAQATYRQVPQEQSAIPRDYTVLIKGLNDIRVYSDSSTYTQRWTANPAWCFARWLTDPDFGLGKYYTYETNIDLPALIAWAAHCDELVANGRGGLETRCRLDIEFRSTIGTAAVMDIFSKAGDCMIVDQGGVWTFVPNRPKETSVHFTQGSYRRDSMAITYISRDERAAALTGAFISSERDYKEDAITVVDTQAGLDDPLLTSIPPERVNLVGITRPSQIQRTLQQALQQTRLSDEIASAEFGLAALKLNVGDVVSLATATGGFSIGSGRILETDQANIQLDGEVSLAFGSLYEITIQGTDDNIYTAPLVNPATASDTPVVTSSVTVQRMTWTTPIQEGLVYSVGQVEQTAQDFRIISKRLLQNYNSELRLLKYDAAVYDVDIDVDDEVEQQVNFEPFLAPGPAVGVTAVQRTVSSIEVVDVAWCVPEFTNVLVSGYRVMFREKLTLTAGDEAVFLFNEVGVTDGTSFEIRDVEPGTYEVRVDALSRGGASTPSDVAEVVVT